MKINAEYSTEKVTNDQKKKKIQNKRIVSNVKCSVKIDEQDCDLGDKRKSEFFFFFRNTHKNA